MLKRYQAPNNNPSTTVSATFDFDTAATSLSSALSDTNVALTSKTSDDLRFITGERADIQPPGFHDECEQHNEG